MNKARAIELLKATEVFLTKLVSRYEFGAMKTTVFYDETNCNGYRLLHDIKTLLDEIEAEHGLLDEIESEDEGPAEHGWLFAYNEETGKFERAGEY